MVRVGLAVQAHLVDRGVRDPLVHLSAQVNLENPAILGFLPDLEVLEVPLNPCFLEVLVFLEYPALLGAPAVPVVPSDPVRPEVQAVPEVRRPL